MRKPEPDLNEVTSLITSQIRNCDTCYIRTNARELSLTALIYSCQTANQLENRTLLTNSIGGLLTEQAQYITPTIIIEQTVDLGCLFPQLHVFCADQKQLKIAFSYICLNM